MYHQTIGKLGYRLYFLGWKNSHQTSPYRCAHLLLSVLFYYRRGFQEGQRSIALFQSSYIRQPD